MIVVPEKFVSESYIQTTHLVLPQNTNQLGNLLGGQLMHWIDIIAALSAAKHTQYVCVTASVDSISFHHPNRLGEVVTLLAAVNRVFSTSMEVGVKVFNESYQKGTKLHTNSAYLTFVAVDANTKPVKANKIIPQTEEEIRRYDEALRRREARLLARQS